MARINRDDIDKFHDYSLYIPKRTIYMGSEEYSIEQGESGTDGLMAERVIKNLTILEALSSDPIIVIMNNIGGDFYHGLALYDAIRNCKSHVTIKVLGHAMSMGSVILQAADKRIMSPLATQMIHYGQFSVDTDAMNAQRWAQEGKRLDEVLENILLTKIREKQPEFTLKKLQKMLNPDTFLTAQESIDLGLADKILGDENE